RTMQRASTSAVAHRAMARMTVSLSITDDLLHSSSTPTASPDAEGWRASGVVVGSVAAGGGADEGGEGGDEAGGVRPSAGVGHVGCVVALGEEDERMRDAQLRAPLVEGHAELVAEQPAEGASAGADRLAELGQ